MVMDDNTLMAFSLHFRKLSYFGETSVRSGYGHLRYSRIGDYWHSTIWSEAASASAGWSSSTTSIDYREQLIERLFNAMRVPRELLGIR